MAVDNLTIRAAVDSFIAGLALTEATGWADRGFIPPVDALSVRLSLLPASKTYLGATGTVADARGLLVFEVWAPIGSEADADALAAQIESALLAAAQLGGGSIWLDGATALEGRPVDGLWRAIVRTSWRAIG